MQAKGMKSSKAGRMAKIMVLLAVAFAAGYLVSSFSQDKSISLEGQYAGQQTAVQEPTWWTCSMHPTIRQPKPGKCPICFMDLIPVSSAEAGIGPRQISFSKEAIKLMEIQTTPVERKFVTAEIRMVGKIDYDETRVKHITAWVPGRIDRLYVDFTGTQVSKGDHMVYLYSPELLSAQAELIQAVRAVENFKAGSSELMKRSILATLEAARDKLRLLGLTAEQIEQIEKTARPVDHLTIYAPIGGIVIEKHATEGVYVTTGTKIYTIADLSRLWVKLDAYESDLPWIRYGQEVEFTTEAYPGEAFTGRISFKNPVLNAKTRTVKLRVNVDNPDGKLKPEMFVRAVVRAKVAAGGMVMEPDMAGKWICPMHPSVIKVETGTCDICDMDLVKAESIYTKIDTPNEPPLVIPASAPLITGKRAVVYVQVPGAEKPTYEGREIVLGPRAGDYYIVKSGLAEGEVVVTNGNFKIDSALQIQAKPSMMSAEGEHKHEIIEVPDEFRRQLEQVIQKYFSLHNALAGDDKDSAVRAAGQILEALLTVDMSLLAGHAHNIWMGNNTKMKTALDMVKQAEAIEQARKAFEKLSNELILVIERFGLYQAKSVYKFHCPMAFNNKGADWLQLDQDTRNPYFGASMLKCGEVVEVIGGKTKRNGILEDKFMKE